MSKEHPVTHYTFQHLSQREAWPTMDGEMEYREMPPALSSSDLPPGPTMLMAMRICIPMHTESTFIVLKGRPGKPVVVDLCS